MCIECHKNLSDEQITQSIKCQLTNPLFAESDKPFPYYLCAYWNQRSRMSKTCKGTSG